MARIKALAAALLIFGAAIIIFTRNHTTTDGELSPPMQAQVTNKSGEVIGRSVSFLMYNQEGVSADPRSAWYWVEDASGKIVLDKHPISPLEMNGNMATVRVPPAGAKLYASWENNDGTSSSAYAQIE